MGGILLHISLGIYIFTYIPQVGDISDSIFMKKLSPLNGIYIVYTVLSRGICNNIPPQPRHFFVLGLRPRTKKCLGFGGLLLHIPLESTVYTLHICILIYEIKILTNILMGFKISCQVGGHGQKFQNYSR